MKRDQRKDGNVGISRLPPWAGMRVRKAVSGALRKLRPHGCCLLALRGSGDDADDDDDDAVEQWMAIAIICNALMKTHTWETANSSSNVHSCVLSISGECVDQRDADHRSNYKRCVLRNQTPFTFYCQPYRPQFGISCFLLCRFLCVFYFQQRY